LQTELPSIADILKGGAAIIPDTFEADLSVWIQGRTDNELKKIDASRFPHHRCVAKITDAQLVELIKAMRDKNSHVSQMLSKGKTDATTTRYKNERICILRAAHYIVRDHVDSTIHETFHEIEGEMDKAISTLKKVKRIASRGKKLLIGSDNESTESPICCTWSHMSVFSMTVVLR